MTPAREPRELVHSFAGAADEYERGRPGWPEEAIAHVGAELRLTEHACVLDLGAGTGKLTRTLVERFDRVLAVEPLGSLRRRLEQIAPSAEVIGATAERIPLPGGSVDAVFAGEAFHWFEGERAIAEIERVLRPRGGLALLWNVLQGTAPPLRPDLSELLGRLRMRAKPAHARYASYAWKRAFEHGSFDQLQQAEFENVIELDRDGLLAYVASQSFVAVLSRPERAAFLDDLRGQIPDGVYRVVFRTDVYWTRRVGAP